MSHSHILIVDEEQQSRSTLRRYLTSEGFDVKEEADGLDALRQILNERFDLVVLDTHLPGINSLELCAIIRSESNIPVVFVSGTEGEHQMIGGFEAGADDFVLKPFSPREVVHRISGILRRTSAQSLHREKQSASSLIVLPRLSLDPRARKITVDGVILDLTLKEYDLLHYLAAHSGKSFSREHLIGAVWKYFYEGDCRTVDTHIKRLREKMNAAAPGSGKLIQTIRGYGYGITQV
ncbi:response regulator transcription factor [Cohnella sp. LGH]|uniref:response regulator transcription factor n=1 Tax=Cohnella sp. LGH TaxID=1619153 RepID=UPI001ADCFF68|nr:response regulator transcription factor [Cohnella sp. LGH]QTH45474.1 response regulator transcription factor [Cohnella sp. LGH]